jgi:hypothetical protein
MLYHFISFIQEILNDEDLLGVRHIRVLGLGKFLAVKSVTIFVQKLLRCLCKGSDVTEIK